MSSHLKICPTCKKEKIQDGIYRNGYVYFYEDTATECPYGHPIIMTSMPDDDFIILSKISDSTDFYDAMIKLHDDDIIEYELKMSQFRSQVEAQEAEAERKKAEDSKPHCPYCNSTNLTKVSGTSRFASTLMFGIGSKKIGKQWKCNNCKSYF